jgi:hypothetical protein
MPTMKARQAAVTGGGPPMATTNAASTPATTTEDVQCSATDRGGWRSSRTTFDSCP